LPKKLFKKTKKLNNEPNITDLKANLSPKETYIVPMDTFKMTIKLNEGIPKTPIPVYKEPPVTEIPVKKEPIEDEIHIDCKDWAKSKLYLMVKALIDLPREGRK